VTTVKADPKVSLFSAAKRWAERAPEVMCGPRGEWSPMLLYEERGGQRRAQELGTNSLDDDHFRISARAIYEILVRARAVRAVLIAPTSAAECDESRPDIRARDRDECLIAMHLDRLGTHVELARIIRTKGKPPQLGPWDGTVDGPSVGGVIADPMSRSPVGPVDIESHRYTPDGITFIGALIGGR
jgi:hypothetical protein